MFFFGCCVHLSSWLVYVRMEKLPEPLIAREKKVAQILGSQVHSNNTNSNKVFKSKLV